MAIDSRDKRASIIGVSSSAPRLEQNPAGRIQKAGRHIAAFLYSGTTIQVIHPVYSNSIGSVRLVSTAEVLELL